MYFHNKLDLLLLEHQRSLPQMTVDYEETNFGDVGQTVFSYHISEKLASLWLTRGLGSKSKYDYPEDSSLSVRVVRHIMETCNKAQIFIFRSQYKIVDYKASCRGCLFLVSFEPKHGIHMARTIRVCKYLLFCFSPSVAISECLTTKLQVE